MTMKLYFHPVSTTSRTVMLFASEAGIQLRYQLVDLMTGEHKQPDYLARNPNGLVPMLEDGDFRLTECSAILKYLADSAGSRAYPKGLRERARVNEMMDWFNTNLYRDFAYGLAYPQLFPHHRRPSEALQSGTLAWARDNTRGWLTTLDKLIGPEQAYLCGDLPTLADYLGAPMLSLGDALRCDFAAYPNVRRWLASMKALPSWARVNEAYHCMVRAVADQQFVTA